MQEKSRPIEIKLTAKLVMVCCSDLPSSEHYASVLVERRRETSELRSHAQKSKGESYVDENDRRMIGGTEPMRAKMSGKKPMEEEKGRKAHRNKKPIMEMLKQ